MNDPENPVPLRMQPRSESDELARRLEREQRAQLHQREDGLHHSLAPFRVGSVPYLNAVPLTRGLENEVNFVPPSELARMLQRDELDAALVSVTEPLLNDRYDIVDGVAVASLGEVKSVFLAHRRPLPEVKEIFCDPASLTSVHLLRVLLAEKGLRPEFKPLAGYEPATMPDYVLLIGDQALNFIRSGPGHQFWDLGAAWYELTNLPFVYAVWALRRGIDTATLSRRLRDARDFGLETLEYIISSRTEFDLDFRKDYLSWHIHYHMGSDEKRGMAQFAELMRRHEGLTVYPPRFV